jgi:hypothetical protein
MQFIVLIIGSILLVVAVRRFGGNENEKIREGMSATQTLFALAAILVGFVWYFAARPDAPRIELTLSGEAFPYKDLRVLLRADAKITNFGQTSMVMENPSNIQFVVSRVIPFDPAALEAKLSAEPPAKGGTIIKYPAMGTIRDDRLILNDMLESGETNQIPYYAVLDCDQEKLVTVTAFVKKPLHILEKVENLLHIRDGNRARSDQFWRYQTIVDLSKACQDSEGKEGDG